MKPPVWIGSKLVIGLLIIALIGVGYMEFSQYRRRAAVQHEINNLSAQARELEGKNKDIAESLQLLNDPIYREKMAREQLNVKKEGEIVVNFPAQINPTTQSAAENPGETNPQKWWRYFFYHQ